MTWDPSAANSHTTNVDLDGNIQNIETGQSKIPSKLKSSTGTATNLEFMETAELVFPGLDYIAAVPKEESQGLKNKIKRGKLFIEDYRDRKAQAQFVSTAHAGTLLSFQFHLILGRHAKIRITRSAKV